MHGYPVMQVVQYHVPPHPIQPYAPHHIHHGRRSCMHIFQEKYFSEKNHLTFLKRINKFELKNWLNKDIF